MCRSQIHSDVTIQAHDGGERQVNVAQLESTVDVEEIAHETFFSVLELLHSQGPVGSDELDTLSTYLRYREEEETRPDYAGEWMLITRNSSNPPPFNNLLAMFSPGTRSYLFAMEILSGRASAFIQLREDDIIRRLYLCPKCRKRAFNQVMDFVPHYSNCRVFLVCNRYAVFRK